MQSVRAWRGSVWLRMVWTDRLSWGRQRKGMEVLTVTLCSVEQKGNKITRKFSQDKRRKISYFNFGGKPWIWQLRSSLGMPFHSTWLEDEVTTRYSWKPARLQLSCSHEHWLLTDLCVSRSHHQSYGFRGTVAGWQGDPSDKHATKSRVNYCHRGNGAAAAAVSPWSRTQSLWVHCNCCVGARTKNRPCAL